jgi:predicted nuclease of predicted toxin-antitoxin system
MWLLDVNLPNGLIQALMEYGIPAETTVTRGWRNLGNGKLAAAAFRTGFRVLLTRDRLFGDSAAQALKNFPELAVVIIRLPQARSDLYLSEFKTKWEQSPIKPIPGQVIEWP